MSMVTEFWRSPADFPLDFGGYRFLGNAVNDLGHAEFPERWTGEEGFDIRLKSPRLTWVGSRWEKGIPSVRQALPNQRAAILQVLAKHRPDLLPAETSGDKARGTVSSLNDKAWEEGVRLAKLEDAPKLEASARFDAVIEMLHQGFLNGSLKAATRPKRGGEYSHFLPPSMWATSREIVKNRFQRCCINPTSPFSIGIDGDDFQFLFVDISSLHLLCAAASSKDAQEAQVSRPLARLTKGDRTIAAAVQDLWPDGIPPMSDSRRDSAIIEAMKSIRPDGAGTSSSTIARFFRKLPDARTHPFKFEEK